MTRGSSRYRTTFPRRARWCCKSSRSTSSPAKATPRTRSPSRSSDSGQVEVQHPVGAERDVLDETPAGEALRVGLVDERGRQRPADAGSGDLGGREAFERGDAEERLLVRHARAAVQDLVEGEVP